MNDFNTVFNAGIHFVERNDIFRIMVTNLHQISDLSV